MSRYSSLLRQRGYPAFALSGALTYAAPSIVNVVVAWTITTAYAQGPGYVGAVAFALVLLGLSATIPTLVSAVFAGALADRWPRRKLMVTVNAVFVIAVAMILGDLLLYAPSPGAAPGGGGLSLPTWIVALYPLAAAVTVSSTLFRPAYNASLPRLVQTEELGPANGLIYSLAIGISVTGSLGATVILPLVGSGIALAIPLGLGLTAQLALRNIPEAIDQHAPRVAKSFFGDVVEGYRFLYYRPALLQLTFGALAFNFLNAMAFVQLALYARVWLGASSTDSLFLGGLLAGATVGAGVGTFLVNFLSFEHRVGRTIVFLAVAQGVTVLLLGLVRSVPFAIVDMFLFGLFPGMVQTIFLATVQGTVPNQMLGRVFAADEVGSYAFVPPGQLAGGYLSLETGMVQVPYLIAGAATVGIAGLLWTMRPLRFLAIPSATPPPPPPGALTSPPPFGPDEIGGA